MFKLEDVSKYYNTNGVISIGLRHINVEFNKGEIIAITGESGGGKSTLLNVITKMDTFDDGEIYYYGNETSYFNVDDMDEFRKNKVGFIFQNYNIIDSYTVLENVIVPLILNGVSRKEAEIKARDLIEKVGLSKRINHRGTKLSGGEKQRCVIARALASDCEILACDEPTGNLDSKTGAEIIKLIQEVAKDKLVLIVTHNFEQVKNIVSRQIVIKDGEVVEDIKIKDIGNQDMNKVMDLEYVPIPKKTLFKIAKNNLLFTPKRSILTMIVFFLISFFALFLYQSIYYNNNNLGADNNLHYIGDNKVIAYDRYHKELDYEKLSSISDDIVINNFFENSGIDFRIGNDLISLYQFIGYEKNLKNYELFAGELPKTNNEVFLVFPKGWSTWYALDKLVGGNMINDNLAFELTVSGVGYSEDVQKPVITKNDMLLKIYQYYNYVKTYDIETYQQYHKFKTILTKEEKSYVTITGEIKEDSYNFNPSCIYPLPTLNIETIYENQTNDILYLSILNDLKMPVYEVALYGDIDDITKKLDELGYDYIIPSDFKTVDKSVFFINNINNYLSMIISSISIIIVYFITYVILARIYESKKKDYTILRTLGVTKNDMKSIVNYEIMCQTILTTIITYSILFVLGKVINNSFFIMFKDVTFITSIIYFVVMLIFGFFMGRRFNYRLFKFSVNKTFKQGVDSND